MIKKNHFEVNAIFYLTEVGLVAAVGETSKLACLRVLSVPRPYGSSGLQVWLKLLWRLVKCATYHTP